MSGKDQNMNEKLKHVADEVQKQAGKFAEEHKDEITKKAKETATEIAKDIQEKFKK